ncbi:1-deoxy-D-xylulose-5-phosphate reductoisomerase [Candidatus Peregrinibacteria bacterium]|nr:1-deoxy-D-xylulose-5-phosphate reductoisomerase [Candidatus Peregrinibacteria bacterium]
MKNVIILGSTGSLGTQTIEVLEKFKGDFKIIGISANKSKELLDAQAEKLGISKENTVLASGNTGGLEKLATHPEADIVVNVLSGIAGTLPTIAALKSGKTLLLGNKESLVAEGKAVMDLARPGQLIPLDSEHNAIFEILKKHPGCTIKKITIPCSGGPFFGKTREELGGLTVNDALKHPKWSMGAKISLESAILINKGLEIVEAHYLFGLPLAKIDTKIHPECQIHGIVEFEELETPQAYVSAPDMREHIENAFLHILGSNASENRIKDLPGAYILHDPDHKTFPGIKIVLDAFKSGPSGMAKFLEKEESILGRATKKTQICSIIEEVSRLRHLG